MGTRVYAVRTGNKYGPEYEDYINPKIPNVTWIREETIGKHQWNKLIPMSLDIDEPVCVIDIDVSFINDYMDMINYPIKRGQFIAAEGWWNDTWKKGYRLQGGFQKYYPKDCKYIYDKFVSTDETVEDVNKIALKKGYLEAGDMVISLAAMPIQEKGMVNTLRVTEVKANS